MVAAAALVITGAVIGAFAVVSLAIHPGSPRRPPGERRVHHRPRKRPEHAMTATGPAPVSRAQLHGWRDGKSLPRPAATRHSSREGVFTC
jgi:hypothetical protein